jgi:hypothetical protein
MTAAVQDQDKTDGFKGIDSSWCPGNPIERSLESDQINCFVGSVELFREPSAIALHSIHVRE